MAVAAALRLASPDPRVSVVIPCLNEAGNIQECIRTARRVLDENGISGEIIVVDNGSDDGSAELADAAGATLVRQPERGYGNAYLAGFDAARGDYIVMIDADLTYDFDEIPRFVRELDRGGDLVMGNRLRGVEPGAMSLLSRVGNPLLSGFLNLLYRTPIRDAHCGMRALRRTLLPTLDLQSTGMEFASEMVIRAARARLEIRELPIALHPRGEPGGWRHLRLMLVYNPTFLFVLPGATMLLLGATVMLLVFARVSILGHGLFIHTLIAGSLLTVAGIQLICFGLCGKIYAAYQLGDCDRWLERMQARLRLEHGLLVGAFVILSGLGIEAVIFAKWISRGLGSLGEQRLAVLAATLVIAGIQIFFTSFLLSLLGLRRRNGTTSRHP